MVSGDKKYEIIIADEVEQMLISHARFLAQVNEAAVERFISDFVERAKSLSNFPERHPWLSDPMIPPRKYRKMLFATRYLLIYQVKGSIVYVDAVVDCRQDYGWLL